MKNINYENKYTVTLFEFNRNKISTQFLKTRLQIFFLVESIFSNIFYQNLIKYILYNQC